MSLFSRLPGRIILPVRPARRRHTPAQLVAAVAIATWLVLVAVGLGNMFAAVAHRW